MIKKITIVINFIAYLCIFAGGVSLFIYAFFILYRGEVTENNISKFVVARFSSPTEYEIDNPFWWLVEGENSLIVRNDSDEKQKGLLYLYLESNPCKKNAIIKISSINFNLNSVIQGSEEMSTELKIPVSVKPYGEIKYSAYLELNENCILKNGDNRNLAAKITDYKFE
jgi:hypothetical protein